MVLVFIGALENITSLIVIFTFLAIVAGSHSVEPALPRIVQEDSEFDFVIAHNIGIWGQAVAIAFDQVADDIFPIFFHEVDDLEIDTDDFRGRTGIIDVILPRTLPKDVFLVNPVFHVGACHAETLLHEQ